MGQAVHIQSFYQSSTGMARFSSDSSSGKETTVEGEGEEDLNSEESTGFDHIEEERQEIKDDHDTTKN